MEIQKKSGIDKCSLSLSIGETRKRPKYKETAFSSVLVMLCLRHSDDACFTRSDGYGFTAK